MNRRIHVRFRWSRLVVGSALGLSLAWSCGGGSGQSCGGCQTDCDNCLPGEDLYECAAPSGSNSRVCAIDDLTADQHCSAIGSVVAGKIQCPGGAKDGGAGTRAGAEESGGADSPKADGNASGSQADDTSTEG